MANRIQLRRDTQANWNRVNPILEDGEPGLDITTNQIKYGDGSSTWTELAYAGGGGSVSFDYSTVQEGDAGLGNVTSITGNPNTGVSLTSDEWAQLMWVPNTANVTIDNISEGGTVYNWAYVDNSGFIVKNETALDEYEWKFGNTGVTTFPGNTLTVNHGMGDFIQSTDPLLIDGKGGLTLSSLPDSGNLSQINLDGYGNIELRSIVSGGADKIWTFNSNGALSTPGSIRLAPGGRFINDGSTGSTASHWINYPDSTNNWFIRLYEDEGANLKARLGLENLSDITIETTSNIAGLTSNGPNHKWTFGGDGTLTTPGNVTIGSGYGNISQIDTIFANNYAYANGVSILSNIGGSYGNADVASYLTNYDGDINFTSSVAIISNVDVITVLDSIRSPAYQFSNGVSILSGLGYGNTEVATYLASGDLETAQIQGNLTVGNLTVNGNITYINTNSYVVTDNIVQFASDNPADTLDLGFVAHRTVGGALQHTGLVRDASTGQWKLFSNVAAQPGSTVDFTGVVYDDLQLDKLYADTIHLTGTAPSTNLGAAGDLEGDIHVDDNYLYYCIQDWTASSWTVGWGGSVGNTLFLTQGDYPTPQVGWIVDQGGNGPWTIDTIVDDGYGSWQITWVGSNFGSPTGGTASLTNPNPAVIWKTVPLNTFQTSAYGNTQVASYLPTYSGNIGNVSTTANVVTTGYFIGNGALLTGIVASGGGTTYSNANVASYLPTYSGNITASNITATGNITANIFVSNTIQGAVTNANTTITAGTYTTTFDTAGNVTAQGNVVANYLFGNGAFLTGVVTSGGSSNYANANVAVFLSSFGSNAISTTGNVTVGNVIGTHYGNAIGTTATYTGNVNVTGYVITSGGFGNITQVDTITANSVVATGNVTVNGVRTTRVISRNIAKGSGYANIDNVSFRLAAGGYAQVSTISSTYDAFWSWRQVFSSNSSSGTFTGATLTTTYSNIGNPTLIGSGGDTLEVLLYAQNGADVYRVTFLQNTVSGNATIIAERVA